MSKLNRLQPMEVRTVRANQFSFNDNNLNVSGYVNETGKQSEPIPNFGEVPDDGMGIEPDEFVEIMQPGVFKNALANADFVDFYLEHDPDKYLASTQQGTLKLNEDNKGLKMSANITPTSWGQDTYTLIKSGAVQSMSFGFIPLEDSWDLNGDTPIRTVTKIQLLEVSAVRFPAYPDSSIDARKKRFTRLNKILEKRGFTLRHIRKNKGGVKMPKKDIKKTEKSASNGSNGMNSTDAQNIVSALGNVAKSIDNQTNAIQQNSEVQSNISDLFMQLANGDRSKKTVHKDSGKGKTEKRTDKKSAKSKKTEKPKAKKPKVEKKSKKTEPKTKESEKREKKPAKKAGIKRTDPKIAKMVKDMNNMPK